MLMSPDWTGSAKATHVSFTEDDSVNMSGYGVLRQWWCIWYIQVRQWRVKRYAWGRTLRIQAVLIQSNSAMSLFLYQSHGCVQHSIEAASDRSMQGRGRSPIRWTGYRQQGPVSGPLPCDVPMLPGNSLRARGSSTPVLERVRVAGVPPPQKPSPEWSVQITGRS